MNLFIPSLNSLHERGDDNNWTKRKSISKTYCSSTVTTKYSVPKKKDESTAPLFIGGFQPSIHQIKRLLTGYKTAQQIHVQLQGLQD
jgi:hypothetical protein